MWREWIPFWRAGDSIYAGDVDLLFVALLAASAAVIVLLFALLLTFAIRYRASNPVNREGHEEKSWRLEVGWTALTLIAFLALFAWGASLYLQIYGTADNALPIYVVAKQWMWKVQHPGGQREINELHLPVGQPVRLILASQDVIHSFFVLAFRVKRDVVPGRYETLSLEAEKVGDFPLLCAEFCGTDHSRMRGRVVVLSAPDYAAWLKSREEGGGSLASGGARLFRDLGCSGCHSAASRVRSPPLEGLYGKPVPLGNGAMVLADEAYLRDSILKPRAQIAAGYEPVMPSYAGRVSEDQLVQLIAYLKSLSGK
jgi:cytochrome c oxidase subunit 2